MLSITDREEWHTWAKMRDGNYEYDRNLKKNRKKKCEKKKGLRECKCTTVSLSSGTFCKNTRTMNVFNALFPSEKKRTK